MPGHKYVRSPIRGQPSTPTHSRQTVRSADITTGPRKSAELCSAAKRVRQRVVAGELDAVVVGGGDGSIRTVASVLAGSDVPLGIIPLGTLNHFARDLRIPVFADRAIAVIASGEKRYVDVGEINGKIFINNSSIGIYPYLVLERERRRRRKRLSKWTAIVLALPASFGICLCFGSGFAFKDWLNHAVARACSLETTNIVSRYQPSAGATDSTVESCVSTWPRCKAGPRCFCLPAVAFSAFSISNATCAFSRAIPPISARAAAGCSSPLTVRLKPCGRR